MLILTDFTILETPYNSWAEIHQALGNPSSFCYGYDIETTEQALITKEMIGGRRYLNDRGLDVWIGIPRRDQALLGLPLDEFDRLRAENERLEKKISRFKTMPWFKRLVFLMIGEGLNVS